MRPKITIFGNSITEESFCHGGWGATLAHHFSRSVDIVLRGYNGYNTRWALKVIDSVFLPDHNGIEGALMAVTVFFGDNDACLADRLSAFLHMPPEEYKQNLRSIVSVFEKRRPQTTIRLITSPPIDEEAPRRQSYIENPVGLPGRTNEVAGAYAKARLEIASPCIDLWTKMQLIPDWKAARPRIVFEEVIMKLRENGLSLESMPVDLPLIGEIDPKNPLKSFEKI